MSAFMNNILPFLENLAGGGEDLVNLIGANLANQGRYDQATGMQSSLRDTILGQITPAFEQRAQGFSNLANESGSFWRSAAQTANQRSRDLWNQATSVVEGMGGQERADINTRFDNMQSQIESDLTARGLSNSTILPGMFSANERERSDSLGGLEERLRQQRLGVMGTFGQNYLNTVAAGNQNYYNAYFPLMGNAIEAQAQSVTQPAQANIDLTNQIVNTILGRQDTYQQTPLGVYTNLGAGSVGAPNYDVNSSQAILGPFAGGVSSGVGTGLGLGIAGLF